MGRVDLRRTALAINGAPLLHLLLTQRRSVDNIDHIFLLLYCRVIMRRRAMGVLPTITVFVVRIIMTQPERLQDTPTSSQHPGQRRRVLSAEGAVAIWLRCKSRRWRLGGSSPVARSWSRVSRMAIIHFPRLRGSSTITDRRVHSKERSARAHTVVREEL